MPEIGEIKYGKELGYKAKTSKYIWQACELCGKERWVVFKSGKPIHTRCFICGNKGGIHSDITKHKQSEAQKRRFALPQNHPSWKGGRIKTKAGYIEIWISPDDFFYPMAHHHDYVMEHRLVMAKSLGRCLHIWETVHHKGKRHKGIENKSDNLIDNLQLTSDLGHKEITRMDQKIKNLERKVIELKEEVARILSNVSI